MGELNYKLCKCDSLENFFTLFCKSAKNINPMAISIDLIELKFKVTYDKNLSILY